MTQWARRIIRINGFKAGAMVNHDNGLGPNDVQGITTYINTNYPAWLLPMPVFPVSMFPDE
ncbi:MAG: hypothetical protein ACRYFU_13455 [Janthinobacterium lividum]